MKNNEKKISVVDGSFLTMTEIKKRLNLMGIKFNSYENNKKYFVKIYNNYVKIEENQKKILNDFKFDINDSEDIWDIHFNLKGD